MRRVASLTLPRVSITKNRTVFLAYLSQAEVYQYSSLPVNVIKEVSVPVSSVQQSQFGYSRWLDISMYDTMFMYGGESLEQRSKVDLDVKNGHSTIEHLYQVS